MENYYLGGYFLVKGRPMILGLDKKEVVYTASDCINDNMVGTWSYSWINDPYSDIENVKQELLLNDSDIQSVRNWVEKADQDKQIGWRGAFTELSAVKEYKKMFFSHLPDLHIIGMYFSETETERLLAQLEHRPQNADLGIYENLTRRTPELSSAHEIFIGYDIVGIEISGNFHTFYCHDIADALSRRFNLTLNEYGLFKEIKNPRAVTGYMNDDNNGCEPVPWFIGKNKLVVTSP